MSAKQKRAKKPPLKKKPQKGGKQTAQDYKEEDSRFDFGGLPQRDLKKNLGCG